MILVDANLLIYAVNADSSQHGLARRWLENTLSDGSDVGFPWVVWLAFIRITTGHGILPKPLPCAQALAYVEEWLERPLSTVVHPGKGHWALFHRLLVATGAAGNLTTDAHIAALALENGAALYSADYDFRRFPGLHHVNPLQEQSHVR